MCVEEMIKMIRNSLLKNHNTVFYWSFTFPPIFTIFQECRTRFIIKLIKLTVTKIRTIENKVKIQNDSFS